MPHPEQFALVIFSNWDLADVPCENDIKQIFSECGREEPFILPWGQSDDNFIKNWLNEPQNRRNDLVAVTGNSGGMKCNGIEIDIVINVASVCKRGCYSTFHPVVMSRAKAMLILSQFQPRHCWLCPRKLGLGVPPIRLESAE